MDKRERKTIEKKTIDYLIQRYSVCGGYDYWIRKELLEEMRDVQKRRYSESY